MKVSVILSNKSSSEIATILPSATVGDALHDLRARRIGALVVSQGNGEIGGILSERDIVRAMAEHGAGTLDRQVSEFMTSTVETCFDSETALVVLGRMTDGRFR
ncbi:MAG: CBS domain-containing protein, partial [Pseudomonadota bacterium]